MWVSCKYEKCSKPNSEYSYINSPINLDYIITIDKKYDENKDRHVLMFFVGQRDCTLYWNYIFECDRDEDYEKILKLIGLK